MALSVNPGNKMKVREQVSLFSPNELLESLSITFTANGKQ